MYFLERLRRFMYGRYGFDQFGRFLFGLGIFFWAVCLLLRFMVALKAMYVIYRVCSFLNTAVYVYAVYRILSRNISRRSLENERYLRIRNKVVPFLNKKTENLRNKEYIFKKCPKCGVKLRLKRIRGKHTTQCPKCGAKFNVRVYIDYQSDYTDISGYH